MDEQSFLTGFDTAEASDPADSFADDWYGESPRRRRVQVRRARVRRPYRRFPGRPSRARLRRAPVQALYAEPAEPEFPEPAEPEFPGPADPSEFPEPPDDGDSYADEWYGEVGDITDSNEAYLEDVDVDLGEDLDCDVDEDLDYDLHEDLGEDLDYDVDEDLDYDLHEDLGEDLDYDFDEDVSMWGESLRGALSEEIAQTASLDEVESLLDSVLESLPAGESFNFGRLLSAALPVAQMALPLAAGAAGTLVGGPVGTAIGTSVGSSLARSLARQQPGPARARAAPSVPAPAAPSVPVPAAPTVPVPAAPTVATPAEPSVPTPVEPSVPTPAAPQGPAAAVQPAAMQAAALANHPVTQQALMAAALGDLGKQTVKGVPVAAYLGALKALFGEAEQEADERMRASADYPAYLLGADGELRVDPAVPAERAHALYDALMNQQT